MNSEKKRYNCIYYLHIINMLLEYKVFALVFGICFSLFIDRRKILVILFIFISNYINNNVTKYTQLRHTFITSLFSL